MGITTVLFLAVALSMDAFAVAVCKGLAMDRVTLSRAAAVGLWFGGFQALMPLLGYLLGINFVGYINAFTPWVAFILLALIGFNMIKEAYSGGSENDDYDATLAFRPMLMMAVATSIDALAVGVTFACEPVRIIGEKGGLVNTLIAVACIGVTTFAISVAGVRAGNIFGTRYKTGAGMAGGIILILLGVKSLLGFFGIEIGL